MEAASTPAASAPVGPCGSTVRSQISGVASLVKPSTLGLAMSSIGEVRSMWKTRWVVTGFPARSATVTSSVCAPSLNGVEKAPLAPAGPRTMSDVTSTASTNTRVVAGAAPVRASENAIWISGVGSFRKALAAGAWIVMLGGVASTMKVVDADPRFEPLSRTSAAMVLEPSGNRSERVARASEAVCAKDAVRSTPLTVIFKLPGAIPWASLNLTTISGFRTFTNSPFAGTTTISGFPVSVAKVVVVVREFPARSAMVRIREWKPSRSEAAVPEAESASTSMLIGDPSTVAVKEARFSSSLSEY